MGIGEFLPSNWLMDLIADFACGEMMHLMIMMIIMIMLMIIMTIMMMIVMMKYLRLFP